MGGAVALAQKNDKEADKVNTMNIAVIGAGLSGLWLANRLQAEGHTVTVFEKSRGTGGRMASKRFTYSEEGQAPVTWRADLGAQYFTARSAWFVREVEAWQRKGWVASWECQPYRVSFSELGSVLEPSPDNTQRWVGIDGMTQLTRQLAAQLQAPSTCLFSRRIIAMTHQPEQGWTLLWQDESKPQSTPQQAQFDSVICTMPIEQVVPLVGEDVLQQSDYYRVDKHGQALEFSSTNRQNTSVYHMSSAPQAVPPATLLASCHQPCVAVALLTRGTMSVEQQSVAAMFVDAVHPSGLSWVSRQDSKPGSAQSMPENTQSWVLHYRPENSQCIPLADNSAAIELAHQQLQDLLGQSLTLLQGHRHYWRYAKPTSAWNACGVIIHRQQSLAITGDWCVGGRVEGALLAAEQVIQQCAWR